MPLRRSPDSADEASRPWRFDAHASFIGLDSGDVDLTTSILNTSKIGVWRIDRSGHYVLMGLTDDPVVTVAAEQARQN